MKFHAIVLLYFWVKNTYFHAILKILNFDYFRLTSQSLTYETEIPFSFCSVRDEGGGGGNRERRESLSCRVLSPYIFGYAVSDKKDYYTTQINLLINSQLTQLCY